MLCYYVMMSAKFVHVLDLGKKAAKPKYGVYDSIRPVAQE